MLVVFFMTTLAEIQDQGHRVHVKTLWRSIDVPKEDVAGIAPSIVEGVGVLRLRRFVFPLEEQVHPEREQYRHPNSHNEG